MVMGRLRSRIFSSGHPYILKCLCTLWNSRSFEQFKRSVRLCHQTHSHSSVKWHAWAGCNPIHLDKVKMDGPIWGGIFNKLYSIEDTLLWRTHRLECVNKWFIPGQRRGNITCPFFRGEVVPEDVVFGEGAIPCWECVEISVSQLDCRYDILDGKIPVVYEHILMNLLRMIRLERNRTNQPRKFNAGFYEETSIMYNVFDNFCASKKSVEEDLKELHAKWTQSEAAFMVSRKPGPALIVSNGFNSFRIRTIRCAIKRLKVSQWNGQEFLQLEHLVWQEELVLFGNPAVIIQRTRAL